MVAAILACVVALAWVHTLITHDSIVVSVMFVLLTAWIVRVNLGLTLHRHLAETVEGYVPAPRPWMLAVVLGAIGTAAGFAAESLQASIPGISSLVGVVTVMFLATLLEIVDTASE